MTVAKFPFPADATSTTYALNGVQKGMATPPATGAHPAFKIEARSPEALVLDNINAFSPGDHFVFEVDPNNPDRMIIPPGPNARIWYVADAARGGNSQADIVAADASVTTEGQVTVAWLKGAGNTMGWGLRSDRPLLFTDNASPGKQVYSAEFALNQTSTGYGGANDGSHQMFFAAGGTYSSGLKNNLFFPFGAQPDPMHPDLFGSFGSANGGRAIAGRESTRTQNGPMAPENFALMGWEIADAIISLNAGGGRNLLIVDSDFSHTQAKGLVVQGAAASLGFPDGTDGLTTYATRFHRCFHTVPGNGSTWASGDDRTDGSFIRDCPNFLEWRCIYDHNGWTIGYNPDGVTWDSGVHGQPPNNQGHNRYSPLSSYGVTSMENINARSTGNSRQQRCGYYSVLNVDAENQLGDLVAGGCDIIQTDSSTNFDTAEDILNDSNGGALVFTNKGNSFNAGTGNVITEPARSAADRAASPVNIGDTLRGATSGVTGVVTGFRFCGQFSAVVMRLQMGLSFQWHTGGYCAPPNKYNGGFNFGDFSVAHLLAANSADPNHPSDLTTKNARHPTINIDTSLDDGLVLGNSDFDGEHVIKGLQKYNTGDLSLNIGIGSAPGPLNEVTLGKWADADAGNGNRTTYEALDYIHAHPNKFHLARDIWNHAATRFGAPAIGHTAGAVCTFSPDEDFDGFATWNPLNWEVAGNPDLPIDGDSIVIPAGEAPASFMTFRFADMDFGAGASWTCRGGYVSIDDHSGTANVKTSRVGQFWFTGSTHAAPIVLESTGGRVGFAADASDVAGSLSDQAHMVILSGASVTVPAGKALSLDGANCRCVLDGNDAGTARLTVGGTLAFTAGTDKHGTAGFTVVKDEKSGAYGYETLGGGVTGQADGGNVTSAVVLASGSTVTVDTTGLASGTYDLIDVDNLTDNGASLPAGVSVNGNKLQVVVI